MKNIIKSILKYLILFVFGGIVYYLIEMCWRGYSHWTMFLLGGACFVSVGLINNIFSWKMPLEIQAVVGAVLITLLELIVGLIVNVKLGWNVWDYSDLPLNFMGQICLPFSVLWCILSTIIIIVDDKIRYKFFNERSPIYTTIIGKHIFLR